MNKRNCGNTRHGNIERPPSAWRSFAPIQLGNKRRRREKSGLQTSFKRPDRGLKMVLRRIRLFIGYTAHKSKKKKKKVYLLRFAVDVDSMPLVVVKTDPRGSNLYVQFAASQVDVESHGPVTQSQRQIILAIAFECHTHFPPKSKEKISCAAPYYLLAMK
jgi:hypothetical protein